MAQIKTCNPCERKDVESECTHWCSDCEEGLCSKCVMDHNAIKLTTNHHVVEVSSAISAEAYQLLSIPYCDKHPELKEDLICKDHDVICCHSCLTEHHKSCKLVSNLDIAARGVRQSGLYTTLYRNMAEIKDAAQKIINDRQTVAEEVRKQQQKIKKQIANVKSKFIEHLNNLEKKLLHELSTIGQENQEDSDDEKNEIKIIEEVEKCQGTLKFVTENASESQVYSMLKKQEKKRDEMMIKLKAIHPASRVRITLEEASHEIESVKSLGYLSVRYDHLEVKTPCQGADESRKNCDTDEICSMLTLDKEVKIVPKNFVGKDEKYDRLGYFKVQCVRMTKDNYLLVAGVIEVYKSNKGYGRDCYRVNRYTEDMSYIDSFLSENWEIKDFICMHDSMKLVVLLDRQLHVINTNGMKSIRCINLHDGHNGISLTENERNIFVQTSCYSKTSRSKDSNLLLYNSTGCLVKIIGVPMLCKSIHANTDDSFTCLSTNDDALCKLSLDGSIIFSYRPLGLSAITVGQENHIYMLIEESIEVLNTKTFEVKIIFNFQNTGKKPFGISYSKTCRKLYLFGEYERVENSNEPADTFIMTMKESF